MPIGSPNGPIWCTLGPQIRANRGPFAGLGSKVAPRQPKGSLLCAFGSLLGVFWGYFESVLGALWYQFVEGLPEVAGVSLDEMCSICCVIVDNIVKHNMI